MLHKRNEKKLVNNYRGISLLDIQGKLYEKVLEHRFRAIQHKIPEHARIPAEHFGFKTNHSVEDAVYCLSEGIKHNLNLGKKVILLSLDIKKGYPSMPRSRMIRELKGMGYAEHLLHAIVATYTDNTSRIITSDPTISSDPYNVTSGLREGAVLSPRCFNSFTSGLFRILKSAPYAELGMTIGDEWHGAQSYADDICVMVADADINIAIKKMQKLMEAILEWAKDCGIQFSTDESENGKGKGKTYVMVFGTKTPTRTKWKLGREVTSINYLGVGLTRYFSHVDHAKNRVSKLGNIEYGIRRIARVNKHVDLAVAAHQWKSPEPKLY
eukprot:g1854.t1